MVEFLRYSKPAKDFEGWRFWWQIWQTNKEILRELAPIVICWPSKSFQKAIQVFKLTKNNTVYSDSWALSVSIRCDLLQMWMYGWFQIFHKNIICILKKKHISLDYSKLSKVVDLTFLHLSIHPIKPGKSMKHLWWQLLVIPGGCIISQRQTLHPLHLKALFLQLWDFQNISARLWQQEFHWRGDGAGMDGAFIGWFNKLHNSSIVINNIWLPSTSLNHQFDFANWPAINNLW